MPLRKYIPCLVLAIGSIISLVHAVPSAGCGRALPAGQTPGGASQVYNFNTTDNYQRRYRIYIPSTYNIGVARPLVFGFHGRSDTSANIEGQTRFSNPSVNPDMVAVYPEGYGSGADYTGGQQWQGDPSSFGINDVLFVNDMIEYFMATYCLDTARIYATGMSNGAGFVLNVLACNDTVSSRIAAFSGAASAPYTSVSSNDCTGTAPDTVPILCYPGRQNIPILEFHGDNDGTIGYFGGARRGACLPSIPRFVTAWSERELHGSTNVSDTPATGVTRYQWGSADNVTGIVTHYRLAGWSKSSAGLLCRT